MHTLLLSLDECSNQQIIKEIGPSPLFKKRHFNHLYEQIHGWGYKPLYKRQNDFFSIYLKNLFLIFFFHLFLLVGG